MAKAKVAKKEVAKREVKVQKISDEKACAVGATRRGEKLDCQTDE